MKKIIVTVVIFVLALGVKAQEEKSGVDFSVGADVVSSYVWRGAIGAGASVQPGATLTLGGLSVGAWGSVDIASAGTKEVDFSIGYEVAGLSLTVTDYWWAGEDVYKYYTYDAHKTNHLFEASLGYTLPVASFPLSLSWNTFFSGADYNTVKDDGSIDRSYSTYIEATYPFSVKSTALEASLGFTPWEGIYANDLSVVNVALKASKEIKITDSFSLPVFGQVITNPTTEDIFFVFGLSF